VLTAVLWLWSWQGARNRARMRRAQETYAAASAASLDAFFVMREVRNPQGEIVDFKIIDANQRAEQMTGCSKHYLCGTTLCTLIPEARTNGMLKHLVDVTRKGGVHEQEWQSTVPQFRARWLRQQVVAVRGGLVAIVRDISERKLAEERMVHLAHHDTLTGLPNRSLISDRLDMTIAQAQRNGGSVLVAFIDLDGFKLINDSLGHGVGDELLKRLAERIRGCLQHNDLATRLGGDEFLVLIPYLEEPDELATLANTLLTVLREPVELAHELVAISASIGIAIYPDHADSPETLVSAADSAMYEAKSQGRNGFQFYTPCMAARARERMQIEQGLLKALELEQLCIFYQPMTNLANGHLSGLEALLRWQHPERGVVGPGEFLPIVEHSDVMIDIGEWVLREALRQLQSWRAFDPLWVISVNIAARHFQRPDFVERLTAILAEFPDVPPHMLELEILESSALSDIAHIRGIMQDCQALGISFALDDFGTGYSSMSYLKRLPADVLKIDQSFVRNMLVDRDDLHLVSAVIGLARSFGLGVIAEGVETIEHGAMLMRLGCDLVQGYGIARPMPADDVLSWVASFDTAAVWQAAASLPPITSLHGEQDGDASQLVLL